MLTSIIVMLVLGWIVQLCLHELSHYLMVRKLGYKVTEFKVWPHKYNGKWYFGRVQYEVPSDEHPAVHHYNQILISSVPLWTAASFNLVWLCFAAYLWMPFISFAFCAFIDQINWWINLISRDETSDGWKWWLARKALKEEMDKR